jgi:mannosyltransferase
MTVHATTIHGTMPRARTPATERVWLLVVCAAAALVYGNGLGRLPLWRDEVASVDIAARSVPRILAALGRIDVVHGLYYLLLHAVLQVDGSEVAVRMPSLAGAVAAVGLAAELARRVLGVVPATVAAAVMIANPLLSFYAREARPYALGVMLVCAAAFVLLGTTWRWRWPLFVVFAVLTTYMHLFDALALAGLASGRLPAERPHPRAVLVGAGGYAVAVAPLVVAAVAQAGQVSWVQRPTGDDIRFLVADLAGSTYGEWAAAVLLAGAVAALALRRRWDGDGALFTTSLLAAVAGPAVLLTVSWLGHPLYVERYVLAAMPMLALALGAAVRLLPATVWVAGIALAVALTGLPAAWTGPASKSEDLRAAAAYLDGAAVAGDCIAYDPSWARLGLEYYLRSPGPWDVALDPGPEGHDPVGLFPAERPEADVVAILRGCPRVWVAGYPGPVGRWRPRPEVTGAALAAVRPGFVASAPMGFGDFTLTLWTSDPRPAAVITTGATTTGATTTAASAAAAAPTVEPAAAASSGGGVPAWVWVAVGARRDRRDGGGRAPAVPPALNITRALDITPAAGNSGAPPGDP